MFWSFPQIFILVLFWSISTTFCEPGIPHERFTEVLTLFHQCEVNSLSLINTLLGFFDAPKPKHCELKYTWC